MPSSVLAVLKVAFLALLYLFIARVVRAVWVEIYAERRSLAEDVPTGAAPAVAPTAPVAPTITAKAKRDRKAADKVASVGSLKVVEPPERRGTSYPVSDEMTVGRAEGCAVSLDDTFASQLHARIFRRENEYYVEDLGSTNGTFLNRKRVHGPVPIRKNDRLQVGNTVMELQR